MKPVLKILFCDDDSQFILTQMDDLTHKLVQNYGVSPDAIQITPASTLTEIEAHLKNSSIEYDLIFCDLGWSNRTLEGIQILNRFQINFPGIETVLYTAQDETDAIAQALSWEVDFIDHIIRIQDLSYFNSMQAIIWTRFLKKRESILTQIKDTENIIKSIRICLEHIPIQGTDELSLLQQIANQNIATDYLFKYLFPEVQLIINGKTRLSVKKQQAIRATLNEILELLDNIESTTINFSGLRILPSEKRTQFIDQSAQKLSEIAQLLRQTMIDFGLNHHDCEVHISPSNTEFHLKESAKLKTNKRIAELIEKQRDFPKINEHDLLALNKELYIRWVKEKYGGFPQLAKERRLDLNNIYRVNRRFKNKPFVVFKFETIREILGCYDTMELESTLRQLLAQEDLLLSSES